MTRRRTNHQPRAWSPYEQTILVLSLTVMAVSAAATVLLAAMWGSR